MTSLEVKEYMIEYDLNDKKFDLTIWVQAGKKLNNVHIEEFNNLDRLDMAVILDLFRYHKPIYWIPEKRIFRVETTEIGKILTLR